MNTTTKKSVHQAATELLAAMKGYVFVSRGSWDGERFRYSKSTPPELNDLIAGLYRALADADERRFFPRTAFQVALHAAIMRTITTWKHDGIVTTSLENLMHHVPVPSRQLAGAPLEADWSWEYGTLFEDLCRQDEHIKQFIF